MDKIDLKRTLDAYQARRGAFRLLEVPPTRYLAIDGHGDPNTSPAYAEALAALYPAAYAIKTHSRRELSRDYVIPPLEGLWWAEDMDAFTDRRDKDRWDWTMMIMVPDHVEDDLAEAALAELARRKPPARSADLEIREMREGLCVQTLHVGSFDDEAPVLERMHEREIPERGLRMRGTHHEVYFSDARRTAPERLRTLLRQPVEPITGSGSSGRIAP